LGQLIIIAVAAIKKRRKSGGIIIVGALTRGFIFAKAIVTLWPLPLGGWIAA
jgi:hypothetical protein